MFRCRVHGSGLRVQGSGFRFWSFGKLRVLTSAVRGGWGQDRELGSGFDRGVGRNLEGVDVLGREVVVVQEPHHLVRGEPFEDYSIFKSRD